MEKLCTIETDKTRSIYDSQDWVDEYSDSVYRFCRSLTYSKEDAEDLFQETFLKAFEQLKKNTLQHPQHYLFSTSLYIWKGWKRKYARRKRLAPVGPLDETMSNDINVEGDFMVKEEARVIRELVHSMPDKFKIPIILYYTMEMGVPDIALTLKIPAGTVKSRLFKARKILEKGLVAINYEK